MDLKERKTEDMNGGNRSQITQFAAFKFDFVVVSVVDFICLFGFFEGVVLELH